MVTRRRSSHHKSKKTHLPPPACLEGEEKQVLQVSGESERQEKPVRDQPPALTTSVPVSVIMEILAREYAQDAQGEVLCRAAVCIAEESGLLEHYRTLWETEETNLSGNQAYLFFERRQCLDLIDFHKSKDNQPALEKELAHLRQLEGRLLLGMSQPTGITDEDLEKLEEFIRYSGF
jgi:hypothetical protein